MGDGCRIEAALRTQDSGLRTYFQSGTGQLLYYHVGHAEALARGKLLRQLLVEQLGIKVPLLAV